MPSWCSNTILISGDKKEILAFAIDVKNHKEDFFEWILPLKQRHYEDTESISQYWGSRSCTDVSVHIFEGYSALRAHNVPKDETKSLLQLCFRSAWCPPANVLRQLYSKYANFQFEFAYDTEHYYVPELC